MAVPPLEIVPLLETVALEPTIKAFVPPVIVPELVSVSVTIAEEVGVPSTAMPVPEIDPLLVMLAEDITTMALWSLLIVSELVSVATALL
jgi:hypothetical protein